MVQINFARKEINCKLVYYGPGLSGKTTNLEMVHERTPQANKGELTSISTDGDRTLFFDFMPLDLGEIAGMKTKFHLYTVPGQVYYNSTRKLVLLGADGVIFVADSSRAKLQENRDSLENLRENLAEMGKDLTKFPIVIQWNKRDMPDAMPVEELEREVNYLGAPTFEGVASKGEGVFQTLKALSGRVLANINSTEGTSRSRSHEPAPAPPAARVEQESADELAEDAAAEPAELVAVPQIERNEIQVGSAPRAAPAATASPRRPAERRAEPAQSQAAPRPQVASNPLEEVGALAAKAPAGPRAGKSAAPAPARPAPAVATLPEQADEAPAEHDVAAPPPRSAGRVAEPRPDGFHREVRVISGRRAGSQRRSSGNSMVIGLFCGVGMAAAAAAAWYLFLA